MSGQIIAGVDHQRSRCEHVTLMTYSRPNIQRLTAYTPGEQSQRPGLIKLNTNENPYPAPKQVFEAIANVDGELLRRYPAADASSFRAIAAKVHGLAPEQVIATNGGDELLRLAMTVFCEPRSEDAAADRGIGIAEPGYSLYPVLAAIHDTSVTSVALAADWSLPADFVEHVLAKRCGLVLLVNPHAPSGRLEPLERLEQIARQLMGQAVLLVDEAYVDFAQHDALALLDPSRGLDNVLLLRSLSKGYSLAGLRFGYGLGHRDLIAALDKARDSYNTNVLAQAAAVAALEARRQAAITWQKVIEQRGRVTQALIGLGCEVYPSEANFVLVRIPETVASSRQRPPTAQIIYKSLKERGIFVRYFEQDRLADMLRITIGTPEQNATLLAAMAEEIARNRG